ncbi:hypothetical protein GC197_04810 [bacterium]|nr:hypothetical protein [bacterium]
MIDFDIQRCTRKCHATNRELRPGDEYFSALVPEGAEVVRQDYSKEAWQGPPEDSICWWKATIPDPQSTKIHWAPHDIMLDHFERLLQDPAQQDAAYVVGLLMVRRKIVRLEETEKGEDGKERLVLVGLKREANYKIPVVEPTAQRIAEIQDELTSLLQSPDPKADQ